MNVAASLEQIIVKRWYGEPGFLKLLSPLGTLYSFLARRRAASTKPSWQSPIPIVIVGNVVVGGTGKTPVLAELVRQLCLASWRPGILSRGYRARCTDTPHIVRPGDTAEWVGDEPLMLASRELAPVCIGADRVAAAQHLLAEHPCDVLLCDDGLQHLTLPRDVEIAVLDAQRGVGNGRCLPVGPLREPIERLHKVDWLLLNGEGELDGFPAAGNFHLAAQTFIKLDSGEEVAAERFSQHISEHFAGANLLAVAGIGHPQRFYQSLRDCGLAFASRDFPDHHRFTAADLELAEDTVLLMTEKDAVKCPPAWRAQSWFLQVEARLPETFCAEFFQRLESLRPKV